MKKVLSMLLSLCLLMYNFPYTKVYAEGTETEESGYTIEGGGISVDLGEATWGVDDGKSYFKFENASVTSENDIHFMIMSFSESDQTDTKIVTPLRDGLNESEDSTDNAKFFSSERGVSADDIADFVSRTKFYSTVKQTIYIVMSKNILPSDVHYFPGTGHFYRYVKDNTLDWIGAYNAARNSTFCGWQGYLVNILSEDENNFIMKYAGANSGYPEGYMGGTRVVLNDINTANVSTDGSTLDYWYWSAGPEITSKLKSEYSNFSVTNLGRPINQEESNNYFEYGDPDINNSVFYNKRTYSANPSFNGKVPFNYTNWTRYEPNNSRNCENSMTNTGGKTTWNDTPYTDVYNGYTIEYGDRLYGNSFPLDGLITVQSEIPKKHFTFYKICLQPNKDKLGSVSGASESDTRVAGSEVTLEAHPEPYSNFVGWVNANTNEVLSTDLVYKFNLNSDLTVFGKFEENSENYKFSFIEHPKPQVVLGGDKATFCVKTKGYDNKYQWYCKNKTETLNSKFSSSCQASIYDFEYIKSGENAGWWKSINKDIHSSTARFESDDFTIESKQTLKFNWKVSSEGNYDKLWYYVINESDKSTYKSEYISGSVAENTKEIELEPGTYKVRFDYTKDSSASRDEDTGYVKDVKILNPDTNEETALNMKNLDSTDMAKWEEVKGDKNTYKTSIKEGSSGSVSLKSDVFEVKNGCSITTNVTLNAKNNGNMNCYLKKEGASGYISSYGIYNVGQNTQIIFEARSKGKYYLEYKYDFSNSTADTNAEIKISDINLTPIDGSSPSKDLKEKNRISGHNWQHITDGVDASWWQPLNKGIENSAAVMESEEFVLEKDAVLKFDWKVNSGGYDDKLCYLIINKSNNSTVTYNSKSGNDSAWGSQEYSLSPGTYAVRFVYSKDSKSENDGDTDMGYVKNVRFKYKDSEDETALNMLSLDQEILAQWVPSENQENTWKTAINGGGFSSSLSLYSDEFFVPKGGAVSVNITLNSKNNGSMYAYLRKKDDPNYSNSNSIYNTGESTLTFRPNEGGNYYLEFCYSFNYYDNNPFAEFKLSDISVTDSYPFEITGETSDILEISPQKNKNLYKSTKNFFCKINYINDFKTLSTANTTSDAAQLTINYRVSFETEKGFKIEKLNSKDLVEEGQSYKFRVIAPAGCDLDKIVATANDAPLRCDNGIYTIKNIVDHQLVKVKILKDQQIVDLPAIKDEDDDLTNPGILGTLEIKDENDVNYTVYSADTNGKFVKTSDFDYNSLFLIFEVSFALIVFNKKRLEDLNELEI